MADPTGQRGLQQRHFLFGLLAIGVLALLLREYFILVARVDSPFRGDIREYVFYAWNLLHLHVFSATAPGSQTVLPDAYRGPGYPLFLATAMLAGKGWYSIALQAQAALGTATVVMGVLLARHWLSRGWSLAAGVLMAVWPHHIVATGALLSEVVFGFMLMLALLMTAEAARRPKLHWPILGGAAWGCAWLVNPLVLLFPPLVAMLFWRGGIRRGGVTLLVVAFTIAGAWGLRSLSLPVQPDMPGRVTINFVQGSWPQYHRARNDAMFTGEDTSPIARSIMQAIDQETLLFNADPRAGLHAMADRMALDPGYYLRWYLLDKPWLLWDWNIRVGDGGVYFLSVTHSPLETHPLLHAITVVLRTLNPAIFALALAGVLGIGARGLRSRDPKSVAPTLVALFCVYVTLVHGVFQAEPRYSIPYRPLELLLAVTTLAAIGPWLGILLERRKPSRAGLAR